MLFNSKNQADSTTAEISTDQAVHICTEGINKPRLSRKVSKKNTAFGPKIPQTSLC